MSPTAFPVSLLSIFGLIPDSFCMMTFISAILIQSSEHIAVSFSWNGGWFQRASPERFSPLSIALSSSDKFACPSDLNVVIVSSEIPYFFAFSSQFSLYFASILRLKSHGYFPSIRLVFCESNAHLIRPNSVSQSSKNIFRLSSPVFSQSSLHVSRAKSTSIPRSLASFARGFRGPYESTDLSISSISLLTSS
jgi:hypothetical protein